MTRPAARPDKDLLFVDVETTGLRPGYHEVIQVGAIRTTPDGKSVKEKYVAKIAPAFISRAEPKALEVNGYTPELWAPEHCTPAGTVALDLLAIGRDTTFAAHNAAFDDNFLGAFLEGLRVSRPWGYHLIDTQTLAQLLNKRVLDIGGYSLDKIAAHFGWPRSEKHDALEDAELARKTYLEAIRLLVERP